MTATKTLDQLYNTYSLASAKYDEDDSDFNYDALDRAENILIDAVEAANLNGSRWDPRNEWLGDTSRSCF